MVEVVESPKSKADFVYKQYTTSRTYYKPRRDNFVKYYKQYRSILDADTTREYLKWRSKLFIPATARALDGWLPDMMLSLFGFDPFFEARPREGEDVLQAQIQEPLLLYQFDACSFFLNFYAFLKQLGLYGTSFGKVMVDENGNNTFEPLEVFNMFYSPRATKLSDTWIAQRNERTLGEMKRMKIYKNLDVLEQNIQIDKETDRYDIEVKKNIQGLPSKYSGEEGDDRRVELIEYWTTDRKKTMTVAGGSTLVRPERENPFGRYDGSWFDPFVNGALWANPFELEGVGIPEKIKDINDRINCEVNQRIDNRNLRMNQIILVRRGANVNVRNLKSFPGAVWMTDDITAVVPQIIPDVSSPASFEEEQRLEQKCEESTGVTKNILGQPTETRRTATEIASNVRMGSKAFMLHLRMNEEQVLKPILIKFAQLNSNPVFMSPEKAARIVGRLGLAWKPTSVIPNFRLLGPSQLMDSNLKVQQMIQFLQIVQNDPMFNKTQIYKRIYEGWGYKDFETLLAPPPMPMMPGMPGMMQGTPMQGQNRGTPLQGTGIPPQTMGGRPVAPTDVRVGSPAEGGQMMMVGGGGERPAI